METDSDTHKGCGPLIAPWSDGHRPMRQQVFDRVRAAGLISRAQVARDPGVSPASVTTITAELPDDALIEEVALARDGGRGRPAIALGVRGRAHLVAGMKLSDRDHTTVISDFAGNMLADDPVTREPLPHHGYY